MESQELRVRWLTGGAESGGAFEWTRVNPTGEETVLEADGPVYWVAGLDVGSPLKVVYTPFEDGVESDRSIVVSPIIPPGLPEARAVAIVREGFTLRGTFEYFGFKPGTHSHCWLRIDPGDGEDTVLAREEGPTSMFEPTAADRRCKLRYAVLPTRADGLPDQWTTAEYMLQKGVQVGIFAPSLPRLLEPHHGPFLDPPAP